MTQVPADSPIRLLHLSDIHFRVGSTWDADPVLRASARFIGEEVRGGLAPDLVIITGDLAHAGKAEEYALARDWLEQLWPDLTAGGSASLPRDRLLLVPGNHDVDRTAVGEGVWDMQEGLLKKGSQEAIAKRLQNDDERGILLKRHAGYLDFYGTWLGQPQALPWWQRRIEIRGQRLHVAGLDSAWMACGDDDWGRLLLGRWQLNQIVDTRKAGDADRCLALVHHPWDYLAEFDSREARQTLHLHRDLLLRGHLHEGEASFVRPPDPIRACLELAAGCIYDGSRYPNAFQWIELYPSPRRVRILFRIWHQGAWQVDRNQPGCPQGEHEVPFEPSAYPTKH
jgi:predicted MPP superfamily phosphohydrolase